MICLSDREARSLGAFIEVLSAPLAFPVSPATGERLTAQSFERYRRTGGQVITFLIPPDALRAALVHPAVMIASDGVRLINGQGHPRGGGTHARVLGRYRATRSGSRSPTRFGR